MYCCNEIVVGLSCRKEDGITIILNTTTLTIIANC